MMKYFYKYLFVIAWALLIFLLSHEPAGESSARSAVIVNTVAGFLPFAESVLTYIVRKSAHVVAFFVLGVLLYIAVRSHKLSAKRAILISVAGVFAYAVFDEVHQLFVPGRSGEIGDVLLDTIAGAAGIASYYFLIIKRKDPSHAGLRERGENG